MILGLIKQRNNFFRLYQRKLEDLYGLCCHLLKKQRVREASCPLDFKLFYVFPLPHNSEKIFFFPTCGDESTPLGAALLVYIEQCLQKNIVPYLPSLEGLYWGPVYSDLDIKTSLHRFENRLDWKISPDIEANIVELLCKGNIIARFAGRMEWGARALGNRSILADGRDMRVIRKLNMAIKRRDFWMPFAPSVFRVGWIKLLNVL